MAQCYECGKPGHHKAQCPNIDRPMTRPRCYECGEWGHHKAQCPNIERPMTRPRCYECGEWGHHKAQCPNIDRPMTRPRCYECGEWGHHKAQCPNIERPMTRPRCYECGEWGHHKAQCPNIERPMTRPRCYECGEWCHHKTQCPNIERPMAKPRCYACNEWGHHKAQCPNINRPMTRPRCYEFGEWSHQKAQCPNIKRPMTQPRCYECGERGHRKADCPRVECRCCRQWGHMARDCKSSGRQQQQRQLDRSHTEDSSHPRFHLSRRPKSSNDQKIPSHWQLSEKYPSLTSAIAGLWKEGIKFRTYPADPNECTEIEQLLKRTWNEDVVGYGADARDLSHSVIEVVMVERVENPELYERYSERKQKLIRRVRDPDLGNDAFSRVDRLTDSSGPVLTTQSLPFDSTLRRNIYPKINEHYLFHGTKNDYVMIISRDGMDNRFGSRRSLLGPGLYTAESCTKADQYTDNKSSRTDELLKMFLVRVLLGEPYVNTEKNPPKFQRPPCMSCQQILCNCPDMVHYDSILDDSGRLFREFVVYEQSQCYPEYIITYRRA